MASLQQLQQQFNPADLRVVTLNQDLPQSAPVRALLDRYGAGQLPAFRDPGSRLGLMLGQTLLPTTLIIGTDGRLLEQLTGPLPWDSPEAVAQLQRYIDQPPTADRTPL